MREQQRRSVVGRKESKKYNDFGGEILSRDRKFRALEKSPDPAPGTEKNWENPSPCPEGPEGPDHLRIFDTGEEILSRDRKFRALEKSPDLAPGTERNRENPSPRSRCPRLLGSLIPVEKYWEEIANSGL